MRSVGKQHRQPYDVRLGAVRRYLIGNETAAQVAVSIGVSEPTMRRYVRELRGTIQEDVAPTTSADAYVPPMQNVVKHRSGGGRS